MTSTKPYYADAAHWGHEASRVEAWKVHLAVQDGTFFAKVAGTQVVYSGTREQVAQQIANFDKTFSRPYAVFPGTVTAPHSAKSIKGTREASSEDADWVGAHVATRISMKWADSMRRDEPAKPQPEDRKNAPDEHDVFWRKVFGMGRGY